MLLQALQHPHLLLLLLPVLVLPLNQHAVLVELWVLQVQLQPEAHLKRLLVLAPDLEPQVLSLQLLRPQELLLVLVLVLLLLLPCLSYCVTWKVRGVQRS